VSKTVVSVTFDIAKKPQFQCRFR